MTIESRVNALRKTIPEGVKIVAVSKFHPTETILQAYDAGQRVFGESRVQELIVKQPELPQDIEWHFVGNLQRNKVKQIAPFISLIHSVGSERLIKEINKQGKANNRVIPCLLQIHIAEEETKSGFSPDECRRFLTDKKWREYPNVQLVGVMGMATFTDDKEKVREEFRLLKTLFDEWKSDFFSDDPSFKEISMGMSDDHPTAIEEGSTMIRLGTILFGER
ncbi:MAG: YggS family pyridoxal phosphate-dependent enzyme [Bacteroidales bacterium]|nr:YggS family pyridoxal phosphate-dependent enzyme [Bacteroidales bacterium]